MLKISGVESRSERRLILEGKLLAPWVPELRTACEKGQRGRSKPRDRPEELRERIMRTKSWQIAWGVLILFQFFTVTCYGDFDERLDSIPRKGINYSPYRDGQQPGGPCPSLTQIVPRRRSASQQVGRKSDQNLRFGRLRPGNQNAFSRQAIRSEDHSWYVAQS